MNPLLEKYNQSHQHPLNKLCHAIGIPLIVISLPLVFFRWQLALFLFGLGWVFQFLGHVFEGKPPAFFSDIRYLWVGPMWLGKKVMKVFKR